MQTINADNAAHLVHWPERLEGESFVDYKARRAMSRLYRQVNPNEVPREPVMSEAKKARRERIKIAGRRLGIRHQKEVQRMAAAFAHLIAKENKE